MPFAGEWFVKRLPLALEPHRRGWDALLAERIDRHDVISPRVFARLAVRECCLGEWLNIEADNWVLIVAPVHAINTIAFQPLLGVFCPFQFALRSAFAGEDGLRGGRDCEEIRRGPAFDAGPVHRPDAICEDRATVWISV